MRAAVVAVVTALAATAAFSGAANAAGDARDGFEGAYWDRWEPASSGSNAQAGYDDDGVPGVAYKGSNNGWLYSAGGWAANRRRIDVSSWGGRANCQARIMANPVGRPNQVELQVWDPNGWRMIATSAPWLQGDVYQPIVTQVNLNGRNVVYVQAIFATTGTSQFVRIDEMELECS
ncbi:MAG: hypothetical protein QOF58_7062 [Pseudonocardiales bacterium]|jgi:hypothetical protein|nr:hypothetical protein [Pseudonocardiales bacterium]